MMKSEVLIIIDQPNGQQFVCGSNVILDNYKERNTRNTRNTKKRTKHSASDEGISPEHKGSCVMASPSADVEPPVSLEVDKPSLGDIHQVLIEVQGTIKQLLQTSFQHRRP